MRRTLYRKLILIYVILAIAGFTLISTVGSRMVEDSLVSSASTSLYREATQIASKQGDLYYHSERSLTDLYNSLSALASYHNSQIWLISADGEILLNTAAALDEENPEIIDGFDPVALGSEYYSTGTFFGYFKDKMLSVMVPVTSDFRINGYVAIHLPLQDVYQQRESLLARIDFLFLLVFGLSFVILIFFSLVVYRPLKKIINGAKEYASGNLTHKIDVKSHDEMGYLASTLNYMSGELNKTGEYQRKFVANVSHDFRSPLTSIKGYVEAILDGTIPPEMQEKYLKIVLFETERLHKLTQSLLTLNDIDDKGNMLDLTSFDINAVIKDTAASFEGTCTKKRISISLILASRTLYVCADMGKIQQVLYNLIDNAIKFSNNDSTITVETTEKHGKVFVSVKDTGCGIPKASITKIWERFYQVDPARSGESSGLGLSMVRWIVQAHGGTVQAESALGEGSTFTVYIPCRLARQEDAVPKRAAERVDKTGLAGRRILLAEDNDLNAEITAELMGEEGLLVDRAENGAHCLEMLEKAPAGMYDAILMDVQMPVLDGYEATQKIRRLTDPWRANIPIIAITANAFAEDRQRALEVGMDDHVAKPIDMAKLIPVLQKQLHKHDGEAEEKRFSQSAP